MNIERINHGRYLIAPTDHLWEAQGTSNSGAVFLPYSKKMEAILSAALGADLSKDSCFQDGFVVCIYTGCGITEDDPVTRQRRGLALFTPALELKYRRKDFILEPDPSPDSVDSLGIEDARVTFTEDKFYLWYCGYNGKDGLACCAESSDLLNWTKHNPLKGNINGTGNKDHVLFPEKIGNKWWLLHRPWGSGLKSADDYVVRLASADALDGEWTDEGILFRGIKSPEQKFSWVGGGAPPLPLGNGKYLLLYHTGCFFQNDYRRYDGACCLIDFEKYEKGHVENMISHRLEPFMVPETPEECNQKLRIDIVFPMSAHLYQEKLYFLYGAGDKATCGASVEWKEIAGLLGQ